MEMILINAEARRVSAVEIDGSLDSIYQAMGVEMIEVATYLPNGDCIFVDEEGCLRAKSGAGLMWERINRSQAMA